ncbi:MAG: acetyl-CoA decarbonylase/synthase complex subunit gamma [Candidatus Coatesbacteria bacterium]
MALSGLAIYKHLPKTNCKDCGVPTCLAFAMKVAAGQASLDDCKHLKPEGKAALSEASAPPQQLVTIGEGGQALSIGQETVLFRHEEKFHRPTAVAVRVSSALDDAALRERCKRIAGIEFERMRSVLKVNLVAVHDADGNAAKFTAAAKTASEVADRALILMSGHVESLKAAGAALKDKHPLLWPLDGKGAEAIAVAKELGLPLVLEAKGFEDVNALAEKARAEGLKQLILSPGTVNLAEGLMFLTATRRGAILKKHRPVGYPVAMMSLGENEGKAVIDACSYVLKYAGIVVVDTVASQHILGILTTRGDVYTDPQVPVQVEAGVHVIGEAGPDSPVLVTTNFALSYCSVEAEVQMSRIPSYILAVNTDGTSVLTAWAADKLNAKTIAATYKSSGMDTKVKHKKIVLPGLVAVLKGGVEDESGLEAIVGPKEASGLVPFLKNQWKP